MRPAGYTMPPPHLQRPIMNAPKRTDILSFPATSAPKARTNGAP